MARGFRIQAVLLVVLGAFASAFAANPAEAPQADRRIVSLGSPVTETLFALGAASEVVAVDESSTYPDAVWKLKRVGYHRQISAEGILSLRPTTVIGTSDAGPPHAIDQLRDAGVEMVVVPFKHDAGSTRDMIRTMGKTLGREEEAAAAIAKLDAKLAQVNKKLEAAKTKPRVLFIYARGGGTLNVAGKATGADSLITIAGGENAIKQFDGYKPLTSEGVVQANPDVLFLLSGGFEAAGKEEGVLALPGVALTNAGKNKRVVTIDDNLALSFGPRLGEGVEALAKALHPELWKDAAESAPAKDGAK